MDGEIIFSFKFFMHLFKISDHPSIYMLYIQKPLAFSNYQST